MADEKNSNSEEEKKIGFFGNETVKNVATHISHFIHFFSEPHYVELVQTALKMLFVMWVFPSFPT